MIQAKRYNGILSAEPAALFLISLFLAVTLYSCADQPQADEKPVARVFDDYLYEEDLQGLFDGALNAEDSSRLKADFIDNWIKQKLVFRIAEENVGSALEGIDKQTEDYRNSLIIYAFEQKWIEQRLDTMLTPAQIETYYLENLQNFRLKEDVYKLDYVLVEPNVVNYDSLRIWFDRQDRYSDNIERYCLIYCLACFLESETWFSTSELNQLFPGAEIDLSPLSRSEVLEIQTDNVSGLFRATDSRNKGDTGPLSYFENDIRKVLLGKRKMELIRNTYRDIYLDGGKRNQYEIY